MRATSVESLVKEHAPVRGGHALMLMGVTGQGEPERGMMGLVSSGAGHEPLLDVLFLRSSVPRRLRVPVAVLAGFDLATYGVAVCPRCPEGQRLGRGVD